MIQTYGITTLLNQEIVQHTIGMGSRIVYPYGARGKYKVKRTEKVFPSDYLKNKKKRKKGC